MAGGTYKNLVTYFGGKSPHLWWLIPLFPKGNYHFVDLMCGAANVALNVNYNLITVNDLNDEIINLFYVLKKHKARFMEQLYFTPFAKSELRNAIKCKQPVNKVDRAIKYYVRCQQGFSGNQSQNKNAGFGAEYFYHNLNGHRANAWANKIKKLPKVIEKLRTFQIHQMDALELFDKVNIKGNIVYIDPPYLNSVRNDHKRYIHETTDDFHCRLAAKVKNAECFVAISGYDSELYDQLFTGLIKHTEKISRSNTQKRPRQECLWVNYDINQLNNTPTLF